MFTLCAEQVVASPCTRLQSLEIRLESHIVNMKMENLSPLAEFLVSPRERELRVE